MQLKIKTKPKNVGQLRSRSHGAGLGLEFVRWRKRPGGLCRKARREGLGARKLAGLRTALPVYPLGSDGDGVGLYPHKLSREISPFAGTCGLRNTSLI